ncbi:MAG: gtrA [Gammaproteobacteria bacterium]|jgi:putative flippase GtrA|nr:gtrA [Gammaproteobacteria bacterium]
MNNANKPYVLIPAFQPEQSLISLVNELLENQLINILVVDDGSGANYQKVFANLPKQVELLTHEKNQGKGAAIKTGIKYLQNRNLEVPIITVDADGQHLVSDVKKIYDQMLVTPESLVLGVRQFDQSVPWRSRFGNELSRKLFRCLYKYPIEDTQTGLRGIPVTLQKEYLQIPATRYEFESECLIMAVKQKVDIIQLPIETVYIENNRSSHFNPIVDSIKIYFVFFRYCLIALLSFAIDISIFSALQIASGNILLSLVTARVVSGGFNFYMNKYKVYRCHDKALLQRQLFQYVLLSLGVLAGSYVLILGLVHGFNWNVIASKIIVDLFLFVMNFLVQKKYIFPAV